MYQICLDCAVVANLKQTIEYKNKTIKEKEQTIKRLQHAFIILLKKRQMTLFDNN